MTQFTSFVAVEEMTVTDGGQPRRIDVPVEMPEGVSHEGVFGANESPRGDFEDYSTSAWRPPIERRERLFEEQSGDEIQARSQRRRLRAKAPVSAQAKDAGYGPGSGGAVAGKLRNWRSGDAPPPPPPPTPLPPSKGVTPQLPVGQPSQPRRSLARQRDQRKFSLLTLR